MSRHSPLEVIPRAVAAAVPDEPYWFVIGGQAVRCFCPYRPSRDVDFGVIKAKDSKQLLAHLRARGDVALLERTRDTVHLTFDGIDVSIFVLKKLGKHVESGALNVTGVLASKTHALLDRGLRRDFFDLYVILQMHALGLLDCLAALREVYESDVNDGLILRALSYFDDADREHPLPGEGDDDWSTVQAFFATAAAALIVPPQRQLEIQRKRVGVTRRPRKRS